MKILSKFLAVLTVLAFSFAPSLVRAQDAPPPGDQGDQSDQGASFQNFYDQLGSQGNWVQTDDYGYVFQPNVTDPNWAPYTDGHWVYNDEAVPVHDGVADGGWTWVSDEPWGWATYHYGRWANIDGTGWVWVPGYRWAPAWVSWRYGGGYCGWAPLPPETFVGAEYGEPGFDSWAFFHFGGDVDVSFNIGPGCYNFVRVGDLGESNYRGRFIDRSNNYTVINKTTNITNISINKTGGAGGNFRGVAVGGPPIKDVNAHSREHIQTVSLAAANQPGQSSVQGKSLSVYAPRMNPASAQQAKPTQVSQTIAHPTFNRGDSITKPLDVTASVRPPAPTPEAIQAAQAAQHNAPAKAKIATENTAVKTPLNKPLTSLQSVAPVHETANTTTSGAKTSNSNTERSTANSAFTGESVKPAVTQPNEVKPTKPVTTYHPPSQSQSQTQVKPTTTYHPPSQSQSQTQVKPTTTYHPQTQTAPAQTYHPQQQQQQQQHQSAPTQTYHPQPQQQARQAQPNYKPGGGGTNNAPGR